MVATNPVASDRSTGARPRRRRTMGAIPRAVWIPVLLLVGLSAWGAPYYLAPPAVRVRHELHDLLRPSGSVGQTAGLLTLAGFLFLWLYPLRKKLGPRRGLGSVPRWLDVHIVVGLTVSLFGAVHASWKFDGLIGLGWWAMFVVVLSGIVGRYVFVRIPRGRTGLEMGAEEVAQQRRQLLVELAGITGLEQSLVESELAADPVRGRGSGVVSGLVQMLRDDLHRRRAVRRLRRRCRELAGEGTEIDESALDRVAELARRQMALSQQARLLDRTQKIFRYWHVFHRPVALTALLAVLVHVVVVVMVGATWFY